MKIKYQVTFVLFRVLLALKIHTIVEMRVHQKQFKAVVHHTA